jgi:microcystin-dependent protein
MGIEILENTLLKLLVRRGTDYDRQQITLDSGELGYTTDTKRLWIGDGTTVGGNLVGNKYKGKAADLTTLAPVDIGDYAFDTDNNSFYICTEGTGSESANWLKVASSNVAGNETITVDVSGGVAVGTISAGNFAADALGAGVTLDSTNRITLSSRIVTDAIDQASTNASDYFTLPSKLKINAIDYTFPGGSPAKDQFLQSNASGELGWAYPSVITTGVAPTTAALIPVGTIVPYVSTAGNVHFPNGWLPCDGREVLNADYPDLSAIITTQYGGTPSSFNVPDFTSRALYGSDDPFNSTLYQVTTSNDSSTSTSLLSATGTLFIIKAVGGVTSPTLTVSKNLSVFRNNVDITGTEFNYLSGNMRIERPTPGSCILTTPGTFASGFQMPAGIEFVKFHVTGSGATGGNKAGGAASTVTGYISAAPGTVFNVTVGTNPTGINANGNQSLISKGGVNLAVSNGGRTSTGSTPLHGEGTINTGSQYVTTGHVITGGYGGVINVNQNLYSNGASSFWGSAPAPGAGGGGENGNGPPIYCVGPGMVKFEWS